MHKKLTFRSADGTGRTQVVIDAEGPSEPGSSRQRPLGLIEVMFEHGPQSVGILVTESDLRTLVESFGEACEAVLPEVAEPTADELADMAEASAAAATKEPVAPVVESVPPSQEQTAPVLDAGVPGEPPSEPQA